MFLSFCRGNHHEVLRIFFFGGGGWGVRNKKWRMFFQNGQLMYLIVSWIITSIGFLSSEVFSGLSEGCIWTVVSRANNVCRGTCWLL